MNEANTAEVDITDSMIEDEAVINELIGFDDNATGQQDFLEDANNDDDLILELEEICK